MQKPAASPVAWLQAQKSDGSDIRCRRP